MDYPRDISRVIVVVLDGLRPDAIAALPNIRHLASLGAHTLRATTVEPSITTAALTSLLTGVAPNVHRVRSDRIGVPRPTEPLMMLPRVLREHGITTRAFLGALPRPLRPLGVRFADHLGIEATFDGQSAACTMQHALPLLTSGAEGLFLLHWPDADSAGHASGWMSPEYLDAGARLDQALAELVTATQLLTDPGTVLIAFADHGGGGVDAHDHCSRHPSDITIPIMMLGGQVAATDLGSGTTLLDIPATIPWLFGIPAPANYAGRALFDGFVPGRHPIAA